MTDILGRDRDCDRDRHCHKDKDCGGMDSSLLFFFLILVIIFCGDDLFGGFFGRC